jgi:ADP-ribosylation factor-like protein 2
VSTIFIVTYSHFSCIAIQHRGLDNAGKTTIVKKLLGEDVHTVSPTLGFRIETLVFQGFDINIWDVGGQKSLRTYWKNYFESTDALIWVVDSSDKMRMRDCAHELHQLLQEERLMGANLLVLANKQDLPGSLSPDVIAQHLMLDQIKTHHWKVLGCSAFTGENIIPGMEWLVNDVSSRLFSLE